MGIDNEKKAKDAYQEMVKGKHQDFYVQHSGLVINPLFTHLDRSISRWHYSLQVLWQRSARN